MTEPLTLRPLRDLLYVRREAHAGKIGSIHLPDFSTRREAMKPRRAVVLAAGPGYWHQKGHWVPNDIKPGQTVLLGQAAGDWWTHDLVHLIVRREDVLG